MMSLEEIPDDKFIAGLLVTMTVIGALVGAVAGYWMAMRLCLP